MTLADAGQSLSPDLLSPRFSVPHPAVTSESEGALKDQVEALERRLIHEALTATGGNILQAAERLGLSRPGLHKKLDRYGLHP